MNLYEIDANLQEAYEACVDENGEIIDEEKLAELDKLQMDRDDKIENICLYIKDLNAYADAIKNEADALTKRRKVAENKAEGLKKYLQGYLAGEKFKSKDGRAVVSYRRSESVKVNDINKLPLIYLKMADPEPKKADIKRALKAGVDIPGAELETKTSMQVK